MKTFGYSPAKFKTTSDTFISFLFEEFADREFQFDDVVRLLSKIENNKDFSYAPFKINKRLVHEILGRYRVRYTELPMLGKKITSRKYYKTHKNHRPVAWQSSPKFKKYKEQLVDSHIRKPDLEVYCLIKKEVNWSREKRERLDYARPLDMHKDSNDSKIDSVVDNLLKQIIKLPSSLDSKILKIKDKNIEERNRKVKLYQKLKADLEKSRPDILRRHLKVLVLDFISISLDDPEMKMSVSRGSNSYSKQSIYNPNGISKKLLTVLDALWVLNYVEYDRGIRNVDDEGQAWSFTRKSRYKIKKSFLTKVTNAPGIKKENIFSNINKPNLILKDRKYDEYLGQSVNTDIEYEINDKTCDITQDLCSYNNLLRHTLIDIPKFPSSGLKTNNPNRNIKINFEDDNDKFVHRVFNNGSLKSGGRYHGGWWQRISPEWRQKIRIDGKPVIEYDYSGMHLVFLYALQGLDYWKDINKDPYDLSEYGYVNDEQMRNFLKVVLQCCVNSDKSVKKDLSKAVKAIEFDINSNYDSYSWTKGYINIEKLIADFCDYHKSIAKYFTTRKGMSLEQLDTFISENVIIKLTKIGIPVLTTNDSYIVPWDVDNIDKIVQSAFKEFYLPYKKKLKVTPKIKEESGIDWFAESSLVERSVKGNSKMITIKLDIPAIEDESYNSRSKRFNKRVSHKNFNENWYAPPLGSYKSKFSKNKRFRSSSETLSRIHNINKKINVSVTTKLSKNNILPKKERLQLINNHYSKAKRLSEIAKEKIRKVTEKEDKKQTLKPTVLRFSKFSRSISIWSKFFDVMRLKVGFNFPFTIETAKTNCLKYGGFSLMEWDRLHLEYLMNTGKTTRKNSTYILR